jgi:hypothetical protein
MIHSYPFFTGSFSLELRKIPVGAKKWPLNEKERLWYDGVGTGSKP